MLLTNNAFQDWLYTAWGAVKDFFNQPIPIIGCTVGFLLISILTIISKTSFGKKWINTLKTWFNDLKNDFVNTVNEWKAFKDNQEKRFEEMKAEQKAEIEKLKEENEELINFICSVLSKSTNKRIKTEVEKYLEGRKHGREESVDN